MKRVSVAGIDISYIEEGAGTQDSFPGGHEKAVETTVDLFVEDCLTTLADEAAA